MKRKQKKIGGKGKKYVKLFYITVILLAGIVISFSAREQQSLVNYAQTVIPSCIPRPSCLYGNPMCGVIEPSGGWCPDAGPTRRPCPKDARICPDGSIVGRKGPKCEFPACPGVGVSPTGEPRPTGKPSSRACVPFGSCWFGQGCPEYSACNGFIKGSCISNKCFTQPVLPTRTPVAQSGPGKKRCEPKSLLGIPIAKIPWFVVGDRGCN
jgi:hypothetical protein